MSSRASTNMLIPAAMIVAWLLPVAGYLLPAGQQPWLWSWFSVPSVLVTCAVTAWVATACFRRQWRSALAMSLAAVVCGATIPVVLVLSVYKQGNAALELAANRYARIETGLTRSAVVELFDGRTGEAVVTNVEHSKRLADSVDFFPAGFGDTIVVYYRRQRVVGKCLHYKSDPRPGFIPSNPGEPSSNRVCY